MANQLRIARHAARLGELVSFYRDGVLYLGGEDAVAEAAARLGIDPAAPANPYWAEHGVTFADPDGFRVVLAPERWGVSRGRRRG
jgi:hypothetical protein